MYLYSGYYAQLGAHVADTNFWKLWRRSDGNIDYTAWSVSGLFVLRVFKTRIKCECKDGLLDAAIAAL